jgi:enoyl-CoA hydratase/carnithine racemase
MRCVVPKASEAHSSPKATGQAGKAVAIRRDGPIATIVIDRRDTRNALTDDVLDGLVDAIEQLAADPEMRVAVLRGAGQQSFGSGMDLNELRKLTPATAQAHFDQLNRCLNAIERAPFPIIAMVYGFAVGGGCELAAACDLRIGAAGARIGVPVGRFGHCPDRENLRRLLRLVSPAAVKAMIMTDMLFSAEEARQMGYFNWVVPDATLEPFTYAIAQTIAQKSPLGLRALKQVLAEVGEGSVAHAEDPTKDTVTSLWATADFQEGVAAFFEKRVPRFRGV